MPSGKRIGSLATNEFAARPAIGSDSFTWILATAAAKPTSSVVRMPAALPVSPRL
jgi:hypothetical protein